MQVTRVKIKMIQGEKGLCAFASVVLNDCLYLGNIAIFSRLNQAGKYRLVFPEKRSGENRIQMFHPLNNNLYFEMEKAITEKINSTI